MEQPELNHIENNDKEYIFNDYPFEQLNEINMENIFNKNANILNPKYNDIKNINNWIDSNLLIDKKIK